MPKLNAGVSRNFNINNDLELLPEVGINIDFARTAALISTDFASITPYAGAELKLNARPVDKLVNERSFILGSLYK